VARPAVFLDRDGVVNRATVVDGRPFPPATVDELEVLPGVVDACTRFHDAGLAVIVVTNQPDVVRGTTTRAAIAAINDALRARVPFDELVVCFHDDADRCGCRKPAPGMLVDAARRWSITLKESVMVGDRWSDVRAGRQAGCATVWVDNGYVERRPSEQDLTVGSLAEAVPWILDHCRSGAVL
jgi:D-glycero-D-manno-heptose 1,7-bisphosphate phosphatase